MRLVLVICAAALTGAIAFAAPPPKAAEVAPAAPDLLYFAENVATELHTRCSGCHSDPEMAGNNFLLTPLNDLLRPDAAIVRKNFGAVLRFLDPHDPGNSPLLKKVLGGSAHGGGTIFADRNSIDYQVFEYFAMGATTRNRPPEAILRRRADVAVGRAQEIDATLSADPDNNKIAFRWKVVEKPSGGKLEVVPADTGTAKVTASRAGVYRLELAVHDGTLWSLPASMLVIATGSAPGPTPSKPATEGMSGGMSDGTAGGMSGGTPPAATRKALLDRRLDPNRLRLIRRLHMDLKWRTPRLDDYERWYPVAHEKMVAAFLADEEVWDAWYERQLFFFLLLDRFRPKDHPVATVPQRLSDGIISVPRALEEIVRSQFFNARNPGNDTYVTVVLEQCLGMVVQERKNKRILDLAKKMYDGYRVKLFKESGDSQADFVRIVFRQKAFHEHFLARTWQDLHGAEIDRKRLDREAERMLADPKAFRKILAEWLTGPAYTDGAAVARTKNEIPYVRGLFLDTLDRMPSYDELRNVRNAFLSLADPTPIRLVMGRVLLESDQARTPPATDPARFVKEQFVRLFARQPTGKELAAFVDGLENDPRVTPRVVLWTLISSLEYQTY